MSAGEVAASRRTAIRINTSTAGQTEEKFFGAISAKYNGPATSGHQGARVQFEIRFESDTFDFYSFTVLKHFLQFYWSIINLKKPIACSSFEACLNAAN